MNWNREVSKNLDHTKVGITDIRDTAERRRVLKTARRWARWQRDQLRTKEAVGRVSAAILSNFNPPDDKHSTWWINPEVSARAAIDALIGDN